MRLRRQETEALLAESREAIDVLKRLSARLEIYTDRLVGELDRLVTTNGTPNGGEDAVR